MTQVFTRRAGNVGGIDTGVYGRVFSGLLVILMMLLLFFLSKAFLGGLAILKPRGIWMRGVWGLVLRMPSGRYKGLVLKIPG